MIPMDSENMIKKELAGYSRVPESSDQKTDFGRFGLHPTCRKTEFEIVALPVVSFKPKIGFSSPFKYCFHLFKFMLIETYSPFVTTSRSRAFFVGSDIMILTSTCSVIRS